MKIRNFLLILALCSSAYAGKEIFEETVSTPPPVEHTHPEAPTSDLTQTSYGHALTKMVLTLAALLALFALSYWLLKKVGRHRVTGMNNLKAIKIRERRPISPKTTLYLIELAGKEILIAESQLDVRSLATYEWPDEDPIPKNSK
ncbi:MAG: flagellar biosynthetic protein FliO [Chlamydiia bacterium]|nr:flagellar biosynthetic protein FliO [Chlamydiia bacterium]